ncbi:MAG: phage tail protein, partial [Clostridia bacterium]|nr:phage tail protein [Clostridia bacterium]
MTPILLAGDTVKGFLPDATSCVVTEERNGIYELELTYPVAGPMFGELREDRYIKAKPNDTADLQLFRIYKITKPIAGIVTVLCEHVSYALAHYPITDVSGTGTPTQAVSAVLAKVNAYLTLSHAFTAVETGWAATKAYKYRVGSARAALGGSEGSLLDTFGGEFEWDNYTVKLHQHRGSDTGVVVAYRKNMTDLKVTTSMESAYTALFPYAVKDETLVTISGGKLSVTNTSGIADRVLIRDFSGEFQGEETVNATTLLAKAQAYLAANNINAPSVNVTVSFIHLWQSPEYAELAALERVSLCDWVTVRHEILGVDVKAQVIKTVYDSLAERYNSIELGSARANLQDTLHQTIHDVTELLKNTDTSAITAAYMQAIADATALITGANGGYVHLLPSGSSPQEIVISNIENYTSSSAKVWR